MKECSSDLYKDGNDHIGLCTLKHVDYLCPFCSHGETIEVHMRSYMSTWGGYTYVYYLSCMGGCMSYQLLKINSRTRPSDLEENKAIQKGKDIFEKMIHFSKNFTDHNKNIDFII